MQAFLVGLQFLTRISFVRQQNWDLADFGKSVKFFPLIGGVLGSIYALTAYFLYFFLPACHIQLPLHVQSIILLVLPVLLTGGLHCDGFMDTMDGIFSGRSRERMLEIMKDSCAGSNAVTAFVVYMLLMWAVLLDFPSDSLIPALFIMPVTARLAMAWAIVLFPYARPDGMGKAFATYAGRKSFYIAALLAILLVFPWGMTAILSFVVSLFFGLLFARYTAGILGGLTGDVYGAITHLTELAVLLIFIVITAILG